MTDPLIRKLADRVVAATPTAPPPFDEIPRRVHRQRVRNTFAVAASAALVAAVVFGGWSLLTPEAAPRPDQPVDSPSPSETASSPPEPTFDGSEKKMSGVVVRLPERDVELRASQSCWTDPDNCFRGMRRFDTDVGSQDAIDFWFARPGWTFDATFRRAGEGCAQETTIEAERVGDQSFRLMPADQAGRYEVTLGGNGPEGWVETAFIWTTTADGPVDPPEGTIALFPESLGEGSYALEMTVDDLAFQPAGSELSNPVRVTVTGADGTERTLTAPLEDSMCWKGRGSFYYQREWRHQDISVLGRSPYDLEVELTIRGTTYIGTATWPRDVIKDQHPYSRLTFTPPLPGAGEQ